MADDLDIEAMLEEPYRQEDRNGNSSREKRHEGNNEDRSTRKSKDKERHRSRDRDRDRGGHDRRRSSPDRSRDSRRRDDRDRGERSGRNEKRRSRERDRGDREKRKSRSRSKDRRHNQAHEKRFGRNRPRSISPVREPEPELTPEERDARTIFCMQLSARIRPRDLEEFFSSVGKVRDVRLILDNKSHRSKGIAYIEFKDVETVTLAIALSGQKLLGVPIIIQPSHAERNRIASAHAAAMRSSTTGPMRLYVGSLHYNITEEMLRGIFEPFGKLDDIKLMKDHQTGRSAGYGFISYHNAEDAKKALDQLNGFELAGRPMKIGNVTERSSDEAATVFDIDEQDRYGFGLGATGRLQLMAKLAEGTGMQLPAAAASVLSAPLTSQAPLAPVISPPIATQCFMISNMFDPNQVSSVNWEQELKDDVITECNKHGGVLHIYIDRGSPQGNVYVKCPSLTAAATSVNAFHGRLFGGRVITAAYVPLPNYHSLFPDSVSAIQFLMPLTARSSVLYASQ